MGQFRGSSSIRLSKESLENLHISLYNSIGFLRDLENQGGTKIRIELISSRYLKVCTLHVMSPKEIPYVVYIYSILPICKHRHEDEQPHNAQDALCGWIHF